MDHHGDRPPDSAAPKASFWSQSGQLMVANGAVAVISTAYVALTGRLLGPERYGTVAAALSLAAMVGLLFGPLETGISKFAAEYHASGDRARLATLTFASLRRLAGPLAIGVVVWLAVGPLLKELLRFDTLGALFAISAYAVFSLLVCVPRGTQRGDHRFFDYGLNQVVEAGSRLTSGAAAVLLGLGAAGAIGGYAAGMAVGFALALWQLRDLRDAPRVALDVRRIYAFSLPLFFVYFFTIFTVNVDILVAKRVLSSQEVGLYGASSGVARLVFVVVTPMYQVLFSRLAVLRARGLGTRPLAGWVTALLAAGLAVGYLLPWLFGREVLTLVFGAEFAAGAPILRIQWVTTSLLILDGVGTFVLLAEDRTRGLLLLLAPCALLAGLLWRFHATATQIAYDGLAAAGAGFVIIALLLFVRTGPAPR
jgi:O-antigen/teichoic acid export membrane protein